MVLAPPLTNSQLFFVYAISFMNVKRCEFQQGLKLVKGMGVRICAAVVCSKG